MCFLGEDPRNGYRILRPAWFFKGYMYMLRFWSFFFEEFHTFPS